jgi:hypothetical protein
VSKDIGRMQGYKREMRLLGVLEFPTGVVC